MFQKLEDAERQLQSEAAASEVRQVGVLRECKKSASKGPLESINFLCLCVCVCVGRGAAKVWMRQETSWRQRWLRMLFFETAFRWAKWLSLAVSCPFGFVWFCLVLFGFVWFCLVLKQQQAAGNKHNNSHSATQAAHPCTLYFCSQLLIVASGVDWAADEELQETMLTLDTGPTFHDD